MILELLKIALAELGGLCIPEICAANQPAIQHPDCLASDLELGSQIIAELQPDFRFRLAAYPRRVVDLDASLNLADPLRRGCQLRLLLPLT